MPASLHLTANNAFTRMIRPLLLATPAAAQNLTARMAPLAAAKGQDGRLAACLQGGGDPEATAAPFTGRGRERIDDDGAGLANFTVTVTVTASARSRDCVSAAASRAGIAFGGTE